jgi:hypothetical protein
MNPACSFIKGLVALAFVGSCLLPVNSPAIDLKQSKFTQVVNDVEIISAADKSLHAAAVSDIFKMPDILRTGPASRTELVAADGTITRVGANTVFSYDTQNRTIDLQQGSLLFHSPHGKGGGTIRTGSATASVIGTTIIVTCTPDGGFKLLDLEGETEVRFLNGMLQHLEPGQMTFILPGGTQPSPVIVFRLDDQIKGSLLLNGFDLPLPSIGKIDAEISRQLLAILNNHVGDTGLIVGNQATVNSVEAFEEINVEHSRQNNNSGGGVTISTGGHGGGVILIDDPGVPITGTGGTIGTILGGNGNIYINNSVLSASGNINISDNSVGGNIDIENSQATAGDSFLINEPSGLVTLNGDTITAVNNADITAGTGITVSGTSITADPDVGTISLNNASGITTINNGSSLQAYTITLNSADGILLDGTSGTFSGNEIDLGSGNADGSDEIDVQNADLTAFAAVNMSAHTINLTDVAFGGESMVHLNSFFGLLADNPNTGAASQPGYVNFINGVTYGGTLITSDNQSTYVNPGSGLGIYIGTLGAGTTSQSANLSAHTVNLVNTTFNAGGSVNLTSFYGVLPNTGGGSISGYVNFINGVNYGGTAVTGSGQTPPTSGGGIGIHINSAH